MSVMRIWTGWCDYSATGEGRTICAMVAMAVDEARFRERVRETLGEYLERGFDVQTGLIRNGVTEALWAPNLLEFIDKNQGAGDFSAHAYLHFNFA